jgi:hypothetical protein
MPCARVRHQDRAITLGDAVRGGSRRTSCAITSPSSYLVVHKGQIPCKRYCKLGHQMPYSRHQCRQERYDTGAWSPPRPGRRCRSTEYR